MKFCKFSSLSNFDRNFINFVSFSFIKFCQITASPCESLQVEASSAAPGKNVNFCTSGSNKTNSSFTPRTCDYGQCDLKAMWFEHYPSQLWTANGIIGPTHFFFFLLKIMKIALMAKREIQQMNLSALETRLSRYVHIW